MAPRISCSSRPDLVGLNIARRNGRVARHSRAIGWDKTENDA
jgi:hypothetical protein